VFFHVGQKSLFFPVGQKSVLLCRTKPIAPSYQLSQQSKIEKEKKFVFSSLFTFDFDSDHCRDVGE